MNDIARHYNMDLPLLRIASGSRYELQTQMEISLNLQYSDRRELENRYALRSREIERILSSLIRELRWKQALPLCAFVPLPL